ncbi:MAG: VOC family protein [Methanomicrobiales archaeon]|nr:VOC family protein [Methanomicrobiales archaeon]
MPTIVHFDISADDTGRARKFYSGLFGWKFETYPGPVEYHLITTSNLDGTLGVGGGLGKRMDASQRGAINYYGVESIDAAMKKVKSLGGKIVSEKMAVPKMGYMVNCQDTEGNMFGLWQADMEAK